MTSRTTDTLYLGIDGGGSKCRARVQGDGVSGVGIAGPANPFQNFEQAQASILAATRAALADAGLEARDMGRLVAGLGLAGVNVPRFYQLMTSWRHPFAAMYLTSDIHVACLGAHGGGDGAVIVAGTGSVGYASIGNRHYSFGGHGIPFGDKGSGAWLGLEAIKAALLALDGLGPDTRLLAAIEQALGVTGIGIVDAMAGARTRDYGRLAPLVLAAAEAGDGVAEAILRDGASYLDSLAERLLATGASGFSLLGGLAPRIRPWMRADLTRCIVEPQHEPDEGAVLFAVDSHRIALTAEA